MGHGFKNKAKSHRAFRKKRGENLQGLGLGKNYDLLNQELINCTLSELNFLGL